MKVLDQVVWCVVYLKSVSMKQSGMDSVIPPKKVGKILPIPTLSQAFNASSGFKNESLLGHNVPAGH